MLVWLKGLDNIIAQIYKNIAALGLMIGILIVGINVCVRYIAGFYPSIGGLTWAEEVARYCFLWSAFFAAAYGFKRGVHIAVTLFIEKLPTKFAKICRIFICMINVVFLSFMFCASLMVCYLNYEIGYMSEALHNVPLWVFLLCLPIAFCGATYYSFQKLYENF